MFVQQHQEPTAEELKKDEIKNASVVIIQCLIRKFLARQRVKQRARRTWQRVFDPAFKIYFWYNKLNGQSQWKIPKFMTLYNDNDHRAARIIGCTVRGFIAKMYTRRKAHKAYTRFYDANLNKYYWMLNSTQKTTWKVSKWLQKQEIPMPPEDQMLVASHLKIKELEDLLKKKDREIKEVRLQRYEELEPQVMKDRVKNAKLLTRPRHMDEWTIDELSAWFTELKMDEYIPTLFKNRVDGYLFINLNEDDWEDLGIANRFHVRKLQLILKAFRIRYQRKKDKIELNEDEELLSEYSPSELSDMIAAENASDDEEEEAAAAEEQGGDGYMSEDESLVLTEEQRLQKVQDEANIQIDMLVAGDGENFPMVGDIVRVRYVCSLVENNKIVTSTKNGMQKDSVEFVLGINQVIKGFDRALPQMSVGERSIIILTPEYAYGVEGLAPHIGPNVEIKFDLTLLGFKPRPEWMKPIIQEVGLSQKPYAPDLRPEMQGKQAADIFDDSASTPGVSPAPAGKGKGGVSTSSFSGSSPAKGKKSTSVVSKF